MSDDVINEAAADIETEGGDEWAPVLREPDADDWTWDPPDIPHAGTPIFRLKQRLQQGADVMTLRGHPHAQNLAIQLVYVQTIGALEAFLCETALYWVEKDDNRVKNCITSLPAFKDQKIPLRDIFTQYDGLKAKVKEYLYHLVWHRWSDVAPLYDKGLGVKLPSTRAFQDALKKRHDIVHRSGVDHEGKPVAVDHGEVVMLSAKVAGFCHGVAEAFAPEGF